jgi:hypothetical protein
MRPAEETEIDVIAPALRADKFIEKRRGFERIALSDECVRIKCAGRC